MNKSWRGKGIGKEIVVRLIERELDKVDEMLNDERDGREGCWKKEAEREMELFLLCLGGRMSCREG